MTERERIKSRYALFADRQEERIHRFRTYVPFGLPVPDKVAAAYKDKNQFLYDITPLIQRMLGGQTGTIGKKGATPPKRASVGGSIRAGGPFVQSPGPDIGSWQTL